MPIFMNLFFICIKRVDENRNRDELNEL